MVERQLHGARRSFAFRRWRRHVIGIGRQTVTREFAVNLGSTRFGVFEFLHDNHSGAFAHDETVAVPIERPRRAFRFVIPRAQRVHGRKPGEANLNDGRFRAAGQKNIGIAEFNHSPRFADRVARGRAGGDDAQIWTVQVELHRDQAARHVADEHRNRERRTARGSLGHEDVN